MPPTHPMSPDDVAVEAASYDEDAQIEAEADRLARLANEPSNDETADDEPPTVDHPPQGETVGETRSRTKAPSYRVLQMVKIPAGLADVDKTALDPAVADFLEEIDFTEADVAWVQVGVAVDAPTDKAAIRASTGGDDVEPRAGTFACVLEGAFKQRVRGLREKPVFYEETWE